MKMIPRTVAAAALLAALSAGAGPENAKNVPPNDAANHADAPSSVVASREIDANPRLSASAFESVLRRIDDSKFQEAAAEAWHLPVKKVAAFKVKARLGDPGLFGGLRPVKIEVSTPGKPEDLTEEQRELAAQYVGSLADGLEKMLAKADQDEREELREKTLAESRAHFAEATVNWNQSRDRLRAETGRFDVSTDAVRSAMASLEQQRQTLELKLAGLEARQQAMQERVKRAAEKAKERIAADDIAAELQKYLQVREEDLQNVRQMVRSGAASSSAAADAAAKVAEAKVKLLERREAAGMGEAAVEPLVQELEKVSLDVVEAQATLKAVRLTLERLGAATSLMDQYDAALAERERARRLLDQVEFGRVSPSGGDRLRQ